MRLIQSDQLNQSQEEFNQYKQKHQELSKLKSENDNLRKQVSQYSLANKKDLIKKLERISTNANIQLNVHSNQAINALQGNCRSLLPKDVMSQQMAMASLNEDILSDWKKNSKIFKNLDEFLSEYKQLQSDCQSLKQEGSSLKVELSEMLESHDLIKDQFGQLLDRFQEYIAEREADQLEKEEQQQSQIHELQTENQKFLADLQLQETEYQHLAQKVREESAKSQIDYYNLQKEHQSLKHSLLQRSHSPQITCLQKDLSLTQQLPQNRSFLFENLQPSKEEFSQSTLIDIVNITKVSEGILMRLSRHQLNPLISHRNAEPLENQDQHQIVQTLRTYTSQIEQLIDQICYNIEHSSQLSDFKEMSDKILAQYEDENQEPQYFYDLLNLYQNLLREALNMDIESGLLKRNIRGIADVLEETTHGSINLNQFLKQNMDEFLQLKIENQQLYRQIEEMQQQRDEKQVTLSEIHSQILNSQSLALPQSNMQNNNNFQIKTNDSVLGGNQTLIQVPSFSGAPQQCDNCLEMRSIYDELESQVTESKSKLDASTDIIRKLEIELDKGEDAIQSIKAPICEIAQFFEKRKIDSGSYPLHVLVEFVRDKVFRLLSKYDGLKQANENFQSLVLKELEHLSFSLSQKKQKRYTSKDTKTDKAVVNFNEEQTTGSVEEVDQNMSKFMQLFRILQKSIETQVESQGNAHQENKQFSHTKNARKLSQQTQASDSRSSTCSKQQQYKVAQNQQTQQLPGRPSISHQQHNSFEYQIGKQYNFLEKNFIRGDNSVLNNRGTYELGQHLSDFNTERSESNINKEKFQKGKAETVLKEASAFTLNSYRKTLENDRNKNQPELLSKSQAISNSYLKVADKENSLVSTSNLQGYKRKATQNHSKPQQYPQQKQTQQQKQTRNPRPDYKPSTNELLTREGLDYYYEKVSQQINSQRCKSAEQHGRCKQQPPKNNFHYSTLKLDQFNHKSQGISKQQIKANQSYDKAYKQKTKGPSQWAMSLTQTSPTTPNLNNTMILPATSSDISINQGRRSVGANSTGGGVGQFGIQKHMLAQSTALQSRLNFARRAQI